MRTSNGTWFVYVRICAACGKEIMLHDPETWAYKRDRKYYCSWKCLRATENKKEKMKMGWRCNPCK